MLWNNEECKTYKKTCLQIRQFNGSVIQTLGCFEGIRQKI